MSFGNALMQAMGRGRVGSLDEAREIVRNSTELLAYTPSGSPDAWDAAYARFLRLREQIGKTD